MKRFKLKKGDYLMAAVPHARTLPVPGGYYVELFIRGSDGTIRTEAIQQEDLSSQGYEALWWTASVTNRFGDAMRNEVSVKKGGG